MNRSSLSVDPPLMVLALVATFIGLFFIFDAGYARSLGDNHGTIPPEFRSQLMFLLPSIIAGVVCTRIRGDFWIKAGPFLWIANLVLLALVLKFGIEKNGAKRWLGVESFAIQPAEFAKLTAVIYLSGIFATRRPWPAKIHPSKDWAHWMDHVFVPKFMRLLPGFLVLLAAALIDREPDLGTAAVLAATGFALFLVGGVSRNSLIAAVCLAGVGGMILVKEEPYRMDRIVNHVQRWDPKNVDDISYQTVQSELAMATGGLVGVGIGNGRAKHVISAPTTDFIMATVAEEFGLLGASLVLAILGGIVFRLVLLGGRAPSRYGRILLYGTASWIGLQACVNVMMANGFLPAIGIPLPFISSGGSSLFALWCALGVCQAVALVKERPEKQQSITRAVIDSEEPVRRTPSAGNLGASF